VKTKSPLKGEEGKEKGFSVGENPLPKEPTKGGKKTGRPEKRKKRGLLGLC